MIQLLHIIILTTVQVVTTDALLEKHTALAPNTTKDNPVLMKILRTVEAATSDERLFDVTLKLLKSLCVCMRETLKVKQTDTIGFSGETNSLQAEDVGDDSNRRVLELYQKIYNKTCFDLREDLTAKANKTKNYALTEENDSVYSSNCGKKAIEDNTESYVKSSSLMLKNNQDNRRLKDIMFKTFIETRDKHNFYIRKYSLFKIPEKYPQNRSSHSIIVILTFPSSNEKLKTNNFTGVNSDELKTVLYSQSRIDIDVIDARCGQKENGTKENFTPKEASNCTLKSIYTFVVQNEIKNNIKVFKLLRKNNSIKLYIDIPTDTYHVDYSRICCNNETNLSLCKIDISRNRNSKEEISGQPKVKKIKKTGNYKDTISKIKTLVKLYDKKINNNKFERINSKPLTTAATTHDNVKIPHLGMLENKGIDDDTNPMINNSILVSKALTESLQLSTRNIIAFPNNKSSSKESAINTVFEDNQKDSTDSMQNNKQTIKMLSPSGDEKETWSTDKIASAKPIHSQSGVVQSLTSETATLRTMSMHLAQLSTLLNQLSTESYVHDDVYTTNRYSGKKDQTAHSDYSNMAIVKSVSESTIDGSPKSKKYMSTTETVLTKTFQSSSEVTELSFSETGLNNTFERQDLKDYNNIQRSVNFTEASEFNVPIMTTRKLNDNSKFKDTAVIYNKQDNSDLGKQRNEAYTPNIFINKTKPLKNLHEDNTLISYFTNEYQQRTYVDGTTAKDTPKETTTKHTSENSNITIVKYENNDKVKEAKSNKIIEYMDDLDTIKAIANGTESIKYISVKHHTIKNPLMASTENSSQFVAGTDTPESPAETKPIESFNSIPMVTNIATKKNTAVDKMIGKKEVSLERLLLPEQKHASNLLMTASKELNSMNIITGIDEDILTTSEKFDTIKQLNTPSETHLQNGINAQTEIDDSTFHFKTTIKTKQNNFKHNYDNILEYPITQSNNGKRVKIQSWKQEDLPQKNTNEIRENKMFHVKSTKLMKSTTDLSIPKNVHSFTLKEVPSSIKTREDEKDVRNIIDNTTFEYAKYAIDTMNVKNSQDNLKIKSLEITGELINKSMLFTKSTKSITTDHFTSENDTERVLEKHSRRETKEKKPITEISKSEKENANTAKSQIESDNIPLIATIISYSNLSNTNKTNNAGKSATPRFNQETIISNNFVTAMVKLSTEQQAITKKHKMLTFRKPNITKKIDNHIAVNTNSYDKGSEKELFAKKESYPTNSGEPKKIQTSDWNDFVTDSYSANTIERTPSLESELKTTIETVNIVEDKFKTIQPTLPKKTDPHTLKTFKDKYSGIEGNLNFNNKMSINLDQFTTQGQPNIFKYLTVSDNSFKATPKFQSDLIETHNNTKMILKQNNLTGNEEESVSNNNNHYSKLSLSSYEEPYIESTTEKNNITYEYETITDNIATVITENTYSSMTRKNIFSKIKETNPWNNKKTTDIVYSTYGKENVNSNVINLPSNDNLQNKIVSTKVQPRHVFFLSPSKSMIAVEPNMTNGIYLTTEALQAYNNEIIDNEAVDVKNSYVETNRNEVGFSKTQPSYDKKTQNIYKNISFNEKVVSDKAFLSVLPNKLQGSLTSQIDNEIDSRDNLIVASKNELIREQETGQGIHGNTFEVTSTVASNQQNNKTPIKLQSKFDEILSELKSVISFEPDSTNDIISPSRNSNENILNNFTSDVNDFNQSEFANFLRTPEISIPLKYNAVKGLHHNFVDMSTIKSQTNSFNKDTLIKEHSHEPKSIITKEIKNAVKNHSVTRAHEKEIDLDYTTISSTVVLNKNQKHEKETDFNKDTTKVIPVMISSEILNDSNVLQMSNKWNDSLYNNENLTTISSTDQKHDIENDFNTDTTKAIPDMGNLGTPDDFKVLHMLNNIKNSFYDDQDYTTISSTDAFNKNQKSETENNFNRDTTKVIPVMVTLEPCIDSNVLQMSNKWNNSMHKNEDHTTISSTNQKHELENDFNTDTTKAIPDMGNLGTPDDFKVLQMLNNIKNSFNNDQDYTTISSTVAFDNNQKKEKENNLNSDTTKVIPIMVASEALKDSNVLQMSYKWNNSLYNDVEHTTISSTDKKHEIENYFNTDMTKVIPDMGNVETPDNFKVMRMLKNIKTSFSNDQDYTTISSTGASNKNKKKEKENNLNSDTTKVIPIMVASEALKDSNVLQMSNKWNNSLYSNEEHTTISSTDQKHEIENDFNTDTTKVIKDMGNLETPDDLKVLQMLNNIKNSFSDELDYQTIGSTVVFNENLKHEKETDFNKDTTKVIPIMISSETLNDSNVLQMSNKRNNSLYNNEDRTTISSTDQKHDIENDFNTDMTKAIPDMGNLGTPDDFKVLQMLNNIKNSFYNDQDYATISSTDAFNKNQKSETKNNFNRDTIEVIPVMVTLEPRNDPNVLKMTNKWNNSLYNNEDQTFGRTDQKHEIKNVFKTDTTKVLPDMGNLETPDDFKVMRMLKNYKTSFSNDQDYTTISNTVAFNKNQKKEKENNLNSDTTKVIPIMVASEALKDSKVLQMSNKWNNSLYSNKEHTTISSTDQKHEIENDFNTDTTKVIKDMGNLETPDDFKVLQMLNNIKNSFSDELDYETIGSTVVFNENLKHEKETDFNKDTTKVIPTMISSETLNDSNVLQMSKKNNNSLYNNEDHTIISSTDQKHDMENDFNIDTTTFIPDMGNLETPNDFKVLQMLNNMKTSFAYDQDYPTNGSKVVFNKSQKQEKENNLNSNTTKVIPVMVASEILKDSNVLQMSNKWNNSLHKNEDHTTISSTNQTHEIENDFNTDTTKVILDMGNLETPDDFTVLQILNKIRQSSYNNHNLRDADQIEKDEMRNYTSYSNEFEGTTELTNLQEQNANLATSSMFQHNPITYMDLDHPEITPSNHTMIKPLTGTYIGPKELPIKSEGSTQILTHILESVSGRYLEHQTENGKQPTNYKDPGKRTFNDIKKGLLTPAQLSTQSIFTNANSEKFKTTSTYKQLEITAIDRNYIKETTTMQTKDSENEFLDQKVFVIIPSESYQNLTIERNGNNSKAEILDFIENHFTATQSQQRYKNNFHKEQLQDINDIKRVSQNLDIHSTSLMLLNKSDAANLFKSESTQASLKKTELENEKQFSVEQILSGHNIMKLDKNKYNFTDQKENFGTKTSEVTQQNEGKQIQETEINVSESEKKVPTMSQVMNSTDNIQSVLVYRHPNNTTDENKMDPAQKISDANYLEAFSALYNTTYFSINSKSDSVTLNAVYNVNNDDNLAEKANFKNAENVSNSYLETLFHDAAEKNEYKVRSLYKVPTIVENNFPYPEISESTIKFEVGSYVLNQKIDFSKDTSHPIFEKYQPASVSINGMDIIGMSLPKFTEPTTFSSSNSFYSTSDLSHKSLHQPNPTTPTKITTQEKNKNTMIFTAHLKEAINGTSLNRSQIKNITSFEIKIARDFDNTMAIVDEKSDATEIDYDKNFNVENSMNNAVNESSFPYTRSKIREYEKNYLNATFANKLLAKNHRTTNYKNPVKQNAMLTQTSNKSDFYETKYYDMKNGNVFEENHKMDYTTRLTNKNNSSTPPVLQSETAASMKNLKTIAKSQNYMLTRTNKETKFAEIDYRDMTKINVFEENNKIDFTTKSANTNVLSTPILENGAEELLNNFNTTAMSRNALSSHTNTKTDDSTIKYNYLSNINVFRVNHKIDTTTLKSHKISNKPIFQSRTTSDFTDKVLLSNDEDTKASILEEYHSPTSTRLTRLNLLNKENEQNTITTKDTLYSTSHIQHKTSSEIDMGTDLTTIGDDTPGATGINYDKNFNEIISKNNVSSESPFTYAYPTLHGKPNLNDQNHSTFANELLTKSYLNINDKRSMLTESKAPTAVINFKSKKYNAQYNIALVVTGETVTKTKNEMKLKNKILTNNINIIVTNATNNTEFDTFEPTNIHHGTVSKVKNETDKVVIVTGRNEVITLESTNGSNNTVFDFRNEPLIYDSTMKPASKMQNAFTLKSTSMVADQIFSNYDIDTIKNSVTRQNNLETNFDITTFKEKRLEKDLESTTKFNIPDLNNFVTSFDLTKELQTKSYKNTCFKTPLLAANEEDTAITKNKTNFAKAEYNKITNITASDMNYKMDLNITVSSNNNDSHKTNLDFLDFNNKLEHTVPIKNITIHILTNEHDDIKTPMLTENEVSTVKSNETAVMPQNDMLTGSNNKVDFRTTECHDTKKVTVSERNNDTNTEIFTDSNTPIPKNKTELKYIAPIQNFVTSDSAHTLLAPNGNYFRNYMLRENEAAMLVTTFKTTSMPQNSLLTNTYIRTDLDDTTNVIISAGNNEMNSTVVSFLNNHGSNKPISQNKIEFKNVAPTQNITTSVFANKFLIPNVQDFQSSTLTQNEELANILDTTFMVQNATLTQTNNEDETDNIEYNDMKNVNHFENNDKIKYTTRITNEIFWSTPILENETATLMKTLNTIATTQNATLIGINNETDFDGIKYNRTKNVYVFEENNKKDFTTRLANKKAFNIPINIPIFENEAVALINNLDTTSMTRNTLSSQAKNGTGVGEIKYKNRSNMNVLDINNQTDTTILFTNEVSNTPILQNKTDPSYVVSTQSLTTSDFTDKFLLLDKDMKPSILKENKAPSILTSLEMNKTIVNNTDYNDVTVVTNIEGKNKIKDQINTDNHNLNMQNLQNNTELQYIVPSKHLSSDLANERSTKRFPVYKTSMSVKNKVHTENNTYIKANFIGGTESAIMISNKTNPKYTPITENKMSTKIYTIYSNEVLLSTEDPVNIIRDTFTEVNSVDMLHVTKLLKNTLQKYEDGSFNTIDNEASPEINIFRANTENSTTARKLSVNKNNITGLTTTSMSTSEKRLTKLNDITKSIVNKINDTRSVELLIRNDSYIHSTSASKLNTRLGHRTKFVSKDYMGTSFLKNNISTDVDNEVDSNNFAINFNSMALFDNMREVSPKIYKNASIVSSKSDFVNTQLKFAIKPYDGVTLARTFNNEGIEKSKSPMKTNYQTNNQDMHPNTINNVMEKGRQISDKISTQVDIYTDSGDASLKENTVTNNLQYERNDRTVDNNTLDNKISDRLWHYSTEGIENATFKVSSSMVYLSTEAYDGQVMKTQKLPTNDNNSKSKIRLNFGNIKDRKSFRDLTHDTKAIDNWNNLIIGGITGFNYNDELTKMYPTSKTIFKELTTNTNNYIDTFTSSNQSFYAGNDTKIISTQSTENAPNLTWNYDSILSKMSKNDNVTNELLKIPSTSTQIPYTVKINLKPTDHKFDMPNSINSTGQDTILNQGYKINNGLKNLTTQITPSTFSESLYDDKVHVANFLKEIFLNLTKKNERSFEVSNTTHLLKSHNNKTVEKLGGSTVHVNTEFSQGNTQSPVVFNIFVLNQDKLNKKKSSKIQKVSNAKNKVFSTISRATKEEKKVLTHFKHTGSSQFKGINKKITHTNISITSNVSLISTSLSVNNVTGLNKKEKQKYRRNKGVNRLRIVFKNVTKNSFRKQGYDQTNVADIFANNDTQDFQISPSPFSKTTKEIMYNTYRTRTEDELDPPILDTILSTLAVLNKKIVNKHYDSKKQSTKRPKVRRQKIPKNIHNKTHSFEKTHLYPIKKTPRKVMQNIKLANRRGETIAMNTADFFSRRREIDRWDKLDKLRRLHPKSEKFVRPVTAFPRQVVLRPIFKRISNRKNTILNVKPVIVQETDKDFFREIRPHTRRQNPLKVEIDQRPQRTGFGDPVIDKPYYLPVIMKPTFLRDKVDSIRSYIYNSEVSGTRKHFLNPPPDLEDEVDPLVYYSRGNSRDEEAEEASTVSTVTRPKKTIFFLSPTVTDMWLDDMYMKVRLPLPINSNPGMVFPGRRFAKVDEVADLAALFIDDLLDYKEMLDRGELPLERATSREKGQPLCMEQFYRLLGVCRVPELVKDRLQLPPLRPEGEQEELVVVACRNHLYPIPVKAADRGRLTAGEMQAQLLAVMVDAAGASPAPRLGLLTALPRDAWARAREMLCADESNRANLELISRALCVVCLDEGGAGAADDTAALLRAMHGGGASQHSANRWFDKTVQLIISSDGMVGMCYEHSAAEGVAVVRLAERALARAAVAARPSPPPALLPAPQAMAWTISRELEKAVEQAAKEIDRNIADLDMRVWTFTGYGREFMKACRASPDVYIQLALQYAYYKMYGRLVSTYESASLRRFRQGRVDNIRSAHAQARAWAEEMCKHETPPGSDDHQKKEQKKLQLFEEAAKKQTAIMEAVIQGRGIDNHLLGLRELARETLGQLPELFTDVTYKQMNEFKLSTSQVATTVDGTFMGYGAVVPDGYGCSYNPKKDSVIFCIASFVSSSVTNTEAFRQHLEEALEAMRLMFQNRQTE